MMDDKTYQSCLATMRRGRAHKWMVIFCDNVSLLVWADSPRQAVALARERRLADAGGGEKVDLDVRARYTI